MRKFRLWLALFLLLGMACSLPGLLTATPAPPTPTPLPTATPVPVPPTLVEIEPPPGSALGPQQALTLYFDQPMDAASVEAALRTEPAIGGRFTWLDDRTVRFEPETVLPSNSTLKVEVGTRARAANGLPLAAPAQATYRTPPTLQVVQEVPAPGAQGIDPTGDLIVAFNQPVVPLGADPASLPPAFTLEPPVSGQGEWLNTSTYRFRPQPALAGGATYTVRLNRDLTALTGAPLDPATSDWVFATAPPRLVQIAPDPEAPWEPTAAVTLTFNQPMNADSVASHFALRDMAGQVVNGAIRWDDSGRVMTFTPDAPLQRDWAYHVTLDAAAQSAGGTPLGEPTDVLVYVLPPLALRATAPADGGTLGEYQALTLYFTAPVDDQRATDALHFDPAVTRLSAYWDEAEGALRISADFRPDTDYTLTVDADLSDRWGESLGTGFALRFHTAPLSPALNLNLFTSAVTVAPERAALPAQAANLETVRVSTAPIALKDFILALAPRDYLNSLRPAPQFSQAVELHAPADRYQDVTLPLAPDGDPLPPGLYLVRLEADALRYPPAPLLVVSSRVHLTYKQGATDALVWAVLADGTPLADAPVRILDEKGNLVASGRTDANGLFHATHTPLLDPYAATYAVVSKVGQDDFGLAVSNWNLGIAPWDFDYRLDRRPPHTQTYLYTDRPIYRPGDTVYFRAVVRTAFNGRYAPPDADQVTITLQDYTGALAASNLPLSAFGTTHGAFTLPDDTTPGVYSLQSGDDAVYFAVADYRKPSVDLQASLSSADLGAPMLGEAHARYFFGAPAANLPLRWSLYVRPETLALPDGYQSGPLTDRWTPYALEWGSPPLGERIAQGETTTNADGDFAVGVPTLPSPDNPCAPPQVCRYTLEVTVTDLNGQPVSARASARVLPGGAVYGVRPTDWVGKAGAALTFEVQAFDADLRPTLAVEPRATFGRVTWENNPDWPSDPFASPLIPVFQPLESAPVLFDAQGHGTVAFTPPESGTYLLRVEQDTSRSEALVWVSGAGSPSWPSLPNQRLPLQADQDAYQPGETAHVLVPNPLGKEVPMLVTVERGAVLDAWTATLPAEGTTLDLPLTDAHAPNVYLSVTLLDAPARTFRQGYLNLPVKPSAPTLTVEARVEPAQAAPGEPVTLTLRVTDADGQPVQGEFSVAVVDRAVLALAEPNAPNIVDAFYGTQPLGVDTALTLAADAERTTASPGGIGGGGGAAETPPLVTRERFPDTALWEGTLTTDANGRAALTIPLPDNLTTWQVLVRGLDAETRVGEATAQIVVNKPVFVRPVTPRFLVVGDRVALAAVVHNTTDQNLSGQVTLQADGVALDDPAQATQAVSLPPQGRARVVWWVTALDVPQADLVFQVTAGDYQDAARPAQGPLPVHRYTAPQTFATAGALEAPGDRLEVAALPRTFAPLGGAMEVTLSPSLGGALVQAVERVAALDLYSNEDRAARLLMIASSVQTLRQAGVASPGLDRAWSVAEADATALIKAQSAEGGWGWWPKSTPSAYQTAFALIALRAAAQAGLAVPDKAFSQGVGYLQAVTAPASALSAGPMLDQLALLHFALAWNGAPAPAELTALARRRAELSPWAQALTLAALELAQPDAPELTTLQSDLAGAAVRSASGVHWESRYPDCGCFDRAEVSTAIVLYALAQRDLPTGDLAGAVRYLMSARTANGDWRTLPADGWAATALAAYLTPRPEDLQPAFAFSADLNGHPLLQGSAHGPDSLNPVSARVPLEDLLPANQIVIHHGDGAGNLYYTVHLTALRPAESAPALDQGIHVERQVEVLSEDGNVHTGDQVRVHLMLTNAQTLFHLQVDEPIPAGAEVIQRALQTAEQGAIQSETQWLPWKPAYFTRFDFGDHVTWVAEELPPGTYELTYTLVLTRPGEYRWLPAHAWQTYFPEVQGTGQGMLFEIQP